MNTTKGIAEEIRELLESKQYIVDGQKHRRIIRSLAEENEHLKEALTENVAKKTGAYESIEEWQGIVQSLRSELAEKDKVLEWYGDTANHRLMNADEYEAGGFAVYNVLEDGGKQARTILSQYAKEAP